MGQQDLFDARATISMPVESSQENKRQTGQLASCASLSRTSILMDGFIAGPSASVPGVASSDVVGLDK